MLPPRFSSMDRNQLVPVISTMGALTASGMLYYLPRVAKWLLQRTVSRVDPVIPSDETAKAMTQPLQQPEQVEEYIRESEFEVIEGAEERVWWAARPHQKTRYCVVFVHGWSACRKECDPIPQRLATSLDANLYCARLPGHGRKHPTDSSGGPYGDALLEEATPAKIFQTALHALRMGLSLGDQVIFVGMSTGAALVTWLVSLPFVRDQNLVHSVILISPAYALGHPLYPVLKYVFASMRIWAPQSWRQWLLEQVLGRTKKNRALSVNHHRYTTLVYPTAAILNLLDVLYSVESVSRSLHLVQVPLLMIGNPQDPVVNFRVTASNAFLQWGDSSRKTLHTLTHTEHPHCVASEMLSPQAVAEVCQLVTNFGRHATPTKMDHQDRVLLKRSSISVPAGLGLYGRQGFPSLSDLRKSLQV